MKYNQLSRCILSLLLSSAFLCGCNQQRPMVAMSEEEHSFQASVGDITILEAEHLEAMDLARVSAAIDVAQEAAVHGLGTSQEIVDGINPLPINQLQAVIRGDRAQKKVISHRDAVLFTCQSESKQKAKYVQEHEKLANRVLALEEALPSPAMTDFDTVPISQVDDSTCVSSTRLFVPPRVSVSQAVPLGVCTLLAGSYIARKIQCYRNALAQCHEKSRRGERWGHVRRDTLNTLLAIAGSEPDKASAFLEILLVAVKDKDCRQQSLKALGKVAQASPDWVSACLPSLRAATRSEDREVRLSALRTLGAAEWKHYFGDVGSAPALPSDMAAILDGPCPFWPNNLVKDTHLLVLIPATVGGVPFTLSRLGELIKHPSNGGHRTKYRYYSERVQAQIGEASPPRSYWLLMTRDVLPGSRSAGYVAQKELVASYASRASVPYELPSVLEAATAILMHHAREGERLFGDDPWTFTRCQEVVHGHSPAVVGGFESSGLHVYGTRYDDVIRGVACCRKFLALGD